MSFSVRQGEDCPTPGCVSAKGEIGPDTVADFQKFLKANPAKTGQVVELDSTGGDVVSALKLGLLLRRYGLGTRIRPADAREGRSGMCASACAYVFAGGVQREIVAGAKIGVHQFSPRAQAPDVSETQRLVGLISIYLEAVGASPKLERLALMTPPDKVRWLTGAEVSQLGLTTASGVQVAETDTPTLR